MIPRNLWAVPIFSSTAPQPAERSNELEVQACLAARLDHSPPRFPLLVRYRTRAITQNPHPDRLGHMGASGGAGEPFSFPGLELGAHRPPIPDCAAKPALGTSAPRVA